MRLAALLLVLANLVVFGIGRDWFGSTPAGREPARAAQQIAPESIRLLDDAAVKRNRDAAAKAAQREIGACLELGDYGAGTAERVREQLAALGLGDRLLVQEFGPPVWYMVYLPPTKSLAEARVAADALRAKGLRDLAVIQDSSTLRNAISLGQFRDLALAKAQQEQARRLGAGDVRIEPRPSGNTTTRFRVSAPDAAIAQKMAELQKETGARLAVCAP